MSLFQAVILGLTQGLTEFLPVSSSAHLLLLPWMMKWDYQGLAYDVALHWGTLLAMACVFWREWLSLARAGLNLPGHSPDDRRLFWGIVIATIPGVAAGLLWDDYVENTLRAPALIAGMLILFALILGAADRLGAKTAGTESLGIKQCLLIGLAQACAIIPGVSRSGITITAALFLGLRRADAARFSFLLSSPIVVAAGVYKLKDLDAAALSGPFWIGIAVSALSGYAAMKLLLRYLVNRNLDLFVAYRVGLGLLVLLLAGANPGKEREKVFLAAQPPIIDQSRAGSVTAKNLRRHVETFAGTFAKRNVYHPETLAKARDYILAELKKHGHKPVTIEFKSSWVHRVPNGTPFHNIEVILSPSPNGGKGIWVIGAHYDANASTPGADDNASGTAALLELSRLLKERPPARETRLVFFSTEEPPCFGTKNMGSYHYAQSLKEKGVNVHGMFSLEMLGFYNDAPGSQLYPPFLHWFFPDTGNFIGIVGDLNSRSLLKAVARGWGPGKNVPIVTAALPRMISAINLSDQYNFWDAGFPGLMVTDSAHFRNPNYHELTDTPEKLDYGRMAETTENLVSVISSP